MAGSIHYEARHGNIEKINSYLAQSPELVNLQDDILGETPLMNALVRGILCMC